MEDYEIAIVGGGGAGLTAAVYAARARRSTIVFEGKVTGGQIATTDIVENFPGFPDGINGFDLAQNMLKQAEKFGAIVEYANVEKLDHADDGTFILAAGSKTYRAKTVIVTAGADYNKLGVPGEAEFTGHGVSYCATCDAAFFRDQDVIVVGGGDAALDEALFTTRYARSIAIVHRRDELRASAILQERAFASAKISFIWDTIVERIDGNGSVTSAVLKNLKTGQITVRPAAAVFIFIGQLPNNHLLKGLVEMDAGGHAIVDLQMQTAVPGLFVAGDIRTKAARQLITAAGDGATAAIAAEHYLAALE
ncbi:MAG: thioredoxin-disulfide reductase [Tepidiformaceae bacterium]